MREWFLDPQTDMESAACERTTSSDVVDCRGPRFHQRRAKASHHFAVTLLARMPEELEILPLLFRSIHQLELPDAAQPGSTLAKAAMVGKRQG